MRQAIGYILTAIRQRCSKGEVEDLLQILRNFVESPNLGVRYGD